MGNSLYTLKITVETLIFMISHKLKSFSSFLVYEPELNLLYEPKIINEHKKVSGDIRYESIWQRQAIIKSDRYFLTTNIASISNTYLVCPVATQRS